MKKIIVASTLICLITLGLSSSEATNHKISSRLAQLIEKHKAVGIKGAKRFAVQSNIRIVQENNVVVVLEVQPGESLKSESLMFYNAELKSKYLNFFETRIPIGQLENIAENFTQIKRIRLPLKPYPVEISEGVNLTGADVFQNDGYKGAGTKVAIIDAGFYAYTDAQSNGDLPLSVTTTDYTNRGIDEEPPRLGGKGSEHGTAVAEIVYDIAPEAELYLIRIGNEVHLGNAKNYCKDNGIDIINHSIAWFNSGPGDGTGDICAIADDAYDNGILWVNSAGNFAQTHWEGTFVDNDSDGWHEFASGDESNTIPETTGSYIVICLRWNDTWNNSNQDYDLYLYNESEFIVARSTDRQSGSGLHPIEEIDYLVTAPGDYHVRIDNYNANGTHTLELFSIYHDFELAHRVNSGSITEPADSSKVLAVGAIYHSDWSSGPQESFSSLGPTNDGRIKPDISGPDGVENFTYGSLENPSDFYGTSASCPHVAGAASLLLCRNTTYTNQQIWDKLENDAIDLGIPYKDNIYGSGKLTITVVPPNAPLNPKCEGKIKPVGLTILNPEFSWIFDDNEEPDDSQTAYQILVSSLLANINSNTADTWDSTKIVLPSSYTTYGGQVLSKGTTYYWKVRTWDEFNAAGPHCSAESFQLLDSTPPAAVADLSANTGPVDGSVLLTWTTPGDDGTTGSFMGNYLIRYSTFNTVWVSTAAQVNVSTGTVIPDTTETYVIDGLTPRITYYLCLWTGDESGNLSEKSNITESIANSIPSAPENFIGIGISTCGIEWTWEDTYLYEDGFYVMDSSSNILHYLGVDATYWIEISTRFTPNTQYARKVAAHAPGGVAKSNLGYAYTLSNPPYALDSTDQSPHTITLTWTQGEGENSRYAVDMSEDGVVWYSSNTKNWDDNINVPTYIYGPPLYHKTTHWFRVWGYNGDGIITSTHTNEISICTKEVTYTIYSSLNGGTENAPDGKTRVEISTGAFVKERYIIINLDPLNNPLEATFDQLNTADSKINTKRKVYDTATEFVVYDLWGLRSIQEFAKDVIITIPYSDVDDDGLVDKSNPLMPGIYEYTLKLYVLNETEKSWKEVENQTLETIENFVSAYIQHFSVYVLLGKAPAKNLTEIAVYPNPCKISGQGITFVNLTEGSRIRIYNLAGELAYSFDNTEGAYTKLWNLRNTNREKVTPGIYIYLVTDWMDKKQKAVGKIAIIR